MQNVWAVCVPGGSGLFPWSSEASRTTAWSLTSRSNSVSTDGGASSKGGPFGPSFLPGFAGAGRRRGTVTRRIGSMQGHAAISGCPGCAWRSPSPAPVGQLATRGRVVEADVARLWAASAAVSRPRSGAKAAGTPPAGPQGHDQWPASCAQRDGQDGANRSGVRQSGARAGRTGPKKAPQYRPIPPGVGRDIRRRRWNAPCLASRCRRGYGSRTAAIPARAGGKEDQMVPGLPELTRVDTEFDLDVRLEAVARHWDERAEKPGPEGTVTGCSCPPCPTGITCNNCGVD
jgi:hypothetical protein